MKLRLASRSRRAAAIPAAPAPTMTQSTSPEGRLERWANAGPTANAAAEPARKPRRDRALMDHNSWFAIGFTLHRDECFSCAILGRTSGQAQSHG
jgi:hypothetical protein